MTKSTITLPHKVKKKRAHVTKSKKLRHLNMIKHGGFSKDPLQVYNSWKLHYPQNSKAVDKLYQKFLTHIRFRKSLLSTPEHDRKVLKILCIKMVSRDLMMGISTAKDFSMPVPSLGIIRPHFLMKKVDSLDDQIQQALRDLGLLAQN